MSEKRTVSLSYSHTAHHTESGDSSQLFITDTLSFRSAQHFVLPHQSANPHMMKSCAAREADVVPRQYTQRLAGSLFYLQRMLKSKDSVQPSFPTVDSETKPVGAGTCACMKDAHTPSPYIGSYLKHWSVRFRPDAIAKINPCLYWKCWKRPWTGADD